MVKAGRHCLIALSGGGGFLFRHRLDKDQVILRMNGTGVLGVTRLSSGSMHPELMIKSRRSAPSPTTTRAGKSEKANKCKVAEASALSSQIYAFEVGQMQSVLFNHLSNKKSADQSLQISQSYNK